MEKPTVLGYMKDQPRALRAAFARRAEFVEPFRQLFVQLPIKKVLFFGSGTSYNASPLSLIHISCGSCSCDRKSSQPLAASGEGAALAASGKRWR